MQRSESHIILRTREENVVNKKVLVVAACIDKWRLSELRRLCWRRYKNLQHPLYARQLGIRYGLNIDTMAGQGRMYSAAGDARRQPDLIESTDCLYVRCGGCHGHGHYRVVSMDCGIHVLRVQGLSKG